MMLWFLNGVNDAIENVSRNNLWFYYVFNTLQDANKI